MSKVHYYFGIGEYLENNQSGGTEYYEKNLPHFKEISKWLKDEWNSAHIERFFKEDLENNIKKCTANLVEIGDGEAFVHVTVEGKEGFRFTEKRRKKVFEQLDAQVIDGWGEGYAHQHIPGLSQDYKLEIL